MFGQETYVWSRMFCQETYILSGNIYFVRKHIFCQERLSGKEMWPRRISNLPPPRPRRQDDVVQGDAFGGGAEIDAVSVDQDVRVVEIFRDQFLDVGVVVVGGAALVRLGDGVYLPVRFVKPPVLQMHVVTHERFRPHQIGDHRAGVGVMRAVPARVKREK